MKLYELAENYAAVLDLIDSGVDGLEDTLEALDGSFEEKIENCVKAWRGLLTDRDACKQEAFRLTERANAFDKKAEALKNYIEVMMRRAGKDKVKTPLYSLNIQNNRESVEEIDRSMIPPQFWKQPEPVLDKQAIKEALKANLPVPGAQLRQTQSLRIR
jgi:hypothetical protein